MQIINDFSYNSFRCVIIRCPRLGRFYKKKYSYIVYTMLGSNFWEKELHSFGYRIKNYKQALKMFYNVCAHIKTIDNLSDIVSLWNSCTRLNEKHYLNKNYAPFWYDALKTVGIL